MFCDVLLLNNSALYSHDCGTFHVNNDDVIVIFSWDHRN